MSEETRSSQGEAGDGIQFDTAKYDQQGPHELKCARCETRIEDTYFQVNDAVVCSSCRWAMEKPLEASGSNIGAYLKALIFGAGAGLAGTAIYFGVLWTTDYELAIVAILVGWMVGKAVFKGSGNKGGLGFQLLAVFVTYAAIVTSYAPFIIKAAMEAEAEPQQIEAGVGEGAPAEGEAASAEEQEAVAASEAAQQSDPEIETEVSISALLMFLGLVIGYSFIVPFMAGFENIIGLVIIAIGLHQAWKGAASVEPQIAGPFSVGGDPSAGAAT